MLWFYSHSQTPGGAGQPRTEPGISGYIVDAETGQGLEFAAISVFTSEDSTLVDGTITDAEGFFTAEVSAGTYDLKIEYISYIPRWVTDVSVTSAGAPVHIGTIALNASSALLEEVEVTGERSEFQLGLDKRIFNVDKNLVTRSGSAADILDNIPSVSVDLEGNVSLRGSENVRILVDGRPSGLVGLSGNDALRALQGDLIERVEVITNPSARYDAEGMAGIINIVLKKDQRGGLNGSFSGHAGYPENYGGSANVNFRRNSVNLFLNYGARYRSSPGSGSLYQEYFPGDTTYFLEQNRDRTRSGWSHNIRFGTDLFLNDKNILTGSFLYRLGDEVNRTKIEYFDYNAQRELTGITTREEVEHEDEPNLEYSVIYKRTFDDEDHTLNAVVQYEDGQETEESDYTERIFDPDYMPAGLPDISQRSLNDEREKEWLAQVDYVRPVSEDGKFEAGYKGDFRDIANDYLVEELRDNAWVELDSRSNEFRYDEAIHAAYLIYGNKYGSFAYQLGVRAEHSQVRTELLATGEVNDRSYTDLFPSVHFGYEMQRDNTIQLSYSRRVRRPGFWHLNPFFSYSDNRNVWSGNPNLEPEYTHSVEMGHIKYWESASVSSSMYFRHSTGVIQRIRTIDEEGVTFTMPQNLAVRDDYGLEFTFSKDVTPVWRIDGNANFFRSITDGGEFGNSDDYNWQGRINSRLTFFNSVETQLRFNYRGPQETTQGRTRSYVHMDLGISKDIMQRKATITLNVRDLFNTRKRRYTAEGEGFYSEAEFQWRARQTTLSFTYRLNEKKRNEQRRGEGGDFEGEELDF